MQSTTQIGKMKEIGYAQPEYDLEFSRKIDEDYEEAKKRKKRNVIIIAVILIIMLMIYFLFRF